VAYPPSPVAYRWQVSRVELAFFDYRLGQYQWW